MQISAASTQNTALPPAAMFGAALGVTGADAATENPERPDEHAAADALQLKALRTEADLLCAQARQLEDDANLLLNCGDPEARAQAEQAIRTASDVRKAGATIHALLGANATGKCKLTRAMVTNLYVTAHNTHQLVAKEQGSLTVACHEVESHAHSASKPAFSLPSLSLATPTATFKRVALPSTAVATSSWSLFGGVVPLPTAAPMHGLSVLSDKFNENLHALGNSAFGQKVSAASEEVAKFGQELVVSAKDLSTRTIAATKIIRAEFADSVNGWRDDPVQQWKNAQQAAQELVALTAQTATALKESAEKSASQFHAKAIVMRDKTYASICETTSENAQAIAKKTTDATDWAAAKLQAIALLHSTPLPITMAKTAPKDTAKDAPKDIKKEAATAAKPTTGLLAWAGERLTGLTMLAPPASISIAALGMLESHANNPLKPGLALPLH